MVLQVVCSTPQAPNVSGAWFDYYNCHEIKENMSQETVSYVQAAPVNLGLGATAPLPGLVILNAMGSVTVRKRPVGGAGGNLVTVHASVNVSYDSVGTPHHYVSVSNVPAASLVTSVTANTGPPSVTFTFDDGDILVVEIDDLLNTVLIRNTGPNPVNDVDVVWQGTSVL